MPKRKRIPKYLEFIERDVPAGKAKRERIALGLAMAERHAVYGEPMTFGVMAAFCGVSESAIHLIFQEGMRKARAAADKVPGLREEWEALVRRGESDAKHRGTMGRRGWGSRVET